MFVNWLLVLDKHAIWVLEESENKQEEFIQFADICEFLECLHSYENSLIWKLTGFSCILIIFTKHMEVTRNVHIIIGFFSVKSLFVPLVYQQASLLAQAKNHCSTASRVVCVKWKHSHTQTVFSLN